jgi:hypothetical protein
VDLADGVAIRLRLGVQDAGGEGAAGARLVLDDDRLAQVAAGDLRHDAHLPIGGAAGGPGDDEPDRPVREAGGAC